MTRVAAIDCGTNSIRLLVADSHDGGLREVVRTMEIVRLGEGVDRTGRLAPEAIARTRAALADYAEVIASTGAERVRMVATSASRDASNADEFRAMVRATLGVAPEVVTGDEEARLSFTGAVRGLPPDAVPPFLVVDIGGGSTEFVLGSGSRASARSERASTAAVSEELRASARSERASTAAVSEELRASARSERASTAAVSEELTVDGAVSVDIGCVRMTERHLRGDPPTVAQVAAAEADIAAAVDRALRAVPGRDAATLVGLAGSVTTVAAIALGLPAYRPERIHHARIPYVDVAKVTDDLLAMTRAQRLEIPVMHPGRADVIGAGALVLRVVMEKVGATSVVASEHDILDGIAYGLLA